MTFLYFRTIMVSLSLFCSDSLVDTSTMAETGEVVDCEAKSRCESEAANLSTNVFHAPPSNDDLRTKMT